MHKDHEDTSASVRRWLRGPSRMAPVAAGLVISAVLLAGCGGSSGSPGVAGAASASSAASASTPASTKAGALAYSHCMRQHGIKDFPDPNSNGQINISAGPGQPDLAPNNPRFSAAQQACKSLMPPPPSAAKQHKDFAAALKFAACMRSHGVRNFPDPPPPSSGPQTQSGGGSQGAHFDPNSPAFQAANSACKSLAPGGAGLTFHASGPGS